MGMYGWLMKVVVRTMGMRPTASIASKFPGRLSEPC